MSPILAAIVFGICAFLAVQIRKYAKLIRSVKNLPGPPAKPIIGNALEVGLNPVEFVRNLFLWWQKYGPGPYRVWLANRLFILVSDPKDVEAVLLSNPPLPKAELYDLLNPWLGEGLLLATGTKWHKRRKMITPSFHFSILVNFFDIINKTSNVFIKKLQEEANIGKMFDVQPLISNCTLDIICETAMGVNIDAMNNPKSEIAQSYEQLCHVMLCRSFSPIEYYNILFKFTGNYKIQQSALNIAKTFATEIIEKRRKLLFSSTTIENGNNNSTNNEMPSKKKVFLDTLLTGTIDGKPLESFEVYEEVSTFMFAGHDTTTSGITFATYCLSRHLEVQVNIAIKILKIYGKDLTLQEKAFEEQRLMFGDDLNRDPTFNDLAGMKYLESVIKESQRMFPSVPMIARQVTEKFDLNGTEVLPGTAFTILLIAMGYNENNFPEPYKFKPERFHTDERIQANPFDFIPFSAGPRNCLGQKFAMMEMKCVLSKMLRHFQILPASDDMPPFKGANFGKDIHELEPLLSSVLTLHSNTGVKIRLRSRNV